MSYIKQCHLSHMQRLIKYVLMCLIIIIAMRYIPDNKIQQKEIIMIGITSSIVFAILDMISPSIKIYKVKSTQDKNKVIVE
jgi:hypothetical protein